jgi:hypothetical protein
MVHIQTYKSISNCQNVCSHLPGINSTLDGMYSLFLKHTKTFLGCSFLKWTSMNLQKISVNLLQSVTLKIYFELYLYN